MAWYRCVGGAGGSLKLRTASGRIATFSTNMVAPFNSLKTDINPVQDLHGYSKPWSGGAGKNKYCDIFSQYTQPNDYRVFPIALTQGQTYKLWASLKGSAVSGCVVALVKDGTQYSNFVGFTQVITSTGSINTVPSFTVDETFTNPKLVVYASTETAFNSIFANYNVQLEVGNQATAYEPYENICPISGFSALNVTRTGKNFANFIADYGIDANGNVVPQAGRYATVAPIPIKSGSSYYCKVFNAVSDVRFIIAVWNGNTLVRRTANIFPNEAIDVSGGDRLYVCAYGDITANFMVTNDNTITEFMPYNGQTATVNFGQTVYGGVADVTNGKVTLTHGIVDLGTLDWITEDSALSGLARVSQNQVIPLGAKYLQTPICTQFEGVYTKSYVNFNNGEIAFSNSEQLPMIRARSTEFVGKTNAQIKALMSGVMLCYELAPPIEITTTPEYLTAIVGQNNVYSDTNGDTEVKYLYRE